MRIAVNTRLLIKNKLDGIGWYSYEILRRICRDHPEHEFIFLFDRPYDPGFIFSPNITPVVFGPPARHPFLWFLWFELRLSRILKKYEADLYVSPDGYMSLRSDCPSLVVIHDINFFHRPLDLPLLSRWYYNFFFPRFAKRAARIATVSRFSLEDIRSTYNIPAEKIKFIYNGSNKIYKPVDEKTMERIREKITDGKRYFIFIGTLHPRKNLSNLLHAYELFRNSTSKEYKLVIVGARLFLNKKIDRIYKKMKYRDDVVFCGRMESGQLAETLSAAEALTFVPYYEGFGLPVIEAMNCDVPVITSNVTSLPEIAGDAALFADPDDIHAIKSAMLRLVFEPGLREDLIEKGKKQRPKFNWDRSARELWELIEDTLNSRG